MSEKYPSKASMPVYNPKTQEQIDADIKELNERLMKYAVMMGIADSMYRQKRISIVTYYAVQDAFSEFYGFTKKSIFYWDGPHACEPAKQPSRKNRAYTRRDTAYWEAYEKTHQK